ncbi:MAG: NlpC/P60 family protein [Pseudomonadota bacterium]
MATEIKNVLDRRLHAFRPDLADAALAGQIEAAHFVEASHARIAVPVCDMRAAPRDDAGLDTQLRLNQPVRVFEQKDGWSWIKADDDDYVGYVRSDALGAPLTDRLTHCVCAPRTFAYPEPDLKKPVLTSLSMGTKLPIGQVAETRGTRYAQIIGGGWVIEKHLQPIADYAADYVSVAETLIGTPYLWGGNSAFGLDCSGLVQLAMAMCNRPVLRDSDMQLRSIGHAVDPDGQVERGDLIFWSGHVAIVRDHETIIHANAHSMDVCIENRAEAIARIAYLYQQPVGYRRP